MRPPAPAIVAATLAAGLVVVPVSSQAVGASPASVQLTAAAAVADQGNGDWQPLGAGLNSAVYDIVVSPDDTVYLAGAFDAEAVVGGPALRYVTSWSPATDSFVPLGAGLGSIANVVEYTDDTLYVGGIFTSAFGGPSMSRIGAWSLRSQTYSPLASGLSGTVHALAIHDDTLYIGGGFSTVNSGPTVNRVAAWADDTFTALDSGVGSSVYSLLLADDTLYLGGAFQEWVGGTVGGMRFTGSWGPLGSGAPGYSPVGPGLNSIAFDLDMSRDDTLFIGGQFTTINGGAPLRGVAQWTPQGGYEPLADGWSDRADAIVVDDTHQLVYAGGIAQYACGDVTCAAGNDDTVPLNRIGVYDMRTQQWVGLADDSGIGVNSSVSTLALDDSAIYVGGFFTASGGGDQLLRVARWTWRPPVGDIDVSGAAGAAVTIPGQSFIGVDAVTIGGQSAVIDYSASSSTSLAVTIPGSLADGTYPISVTAVGGTATLSSVAVVGAAPVPPPAPVTASAPVSVTVVGDGASGVVSWLPPVSSGSFPVSTYQVLAAPSGRSCLTGVLTCTVSGLPWQQPQTVRVRALTGAGWGAWSEPVPVPAVWLRGVREGRVVSLSGVTAGMGLGAIATVWIDAGRGVREMRRTALVSEGGSFAWTKRIKRDVPVRVYVTVGETRSNVLRLR